MRVAPIEPPPDFLAAAESLGIAFDPGDLDRLGQYLALLLEANRTHNLTAITDPAQAWHRHVLDALTLVPLLAGFDPGSGGQAPPAPALDAPAAPRRPMLVIDIGSGGGVPGIPLATVLPAVRFTLLEATGKKARFLSRAVSDLGLANAEVVNARAERIGHDPAHRAHYDAAIARAVGHLAVVAELAVPLVKPQGLVLAVKGAKADEELAQAAGALTLLKAHHEFTQPTPTGRIVVLRKDAATPRIYPRRDGEPKRKPLGL
jgi:16S rRNA (guanine527-N7)-methyltransferase